MKQFNATFLITGLVFFSLATLKSEGFVDEGNCTNIPLEANQTFTGSAVDVSMFSLLTVSLYGEPYNASGDLAFEFSPDGEHWDSKIIYMVKNLTQEPSHSIDPRYRYFRIKYTNGPVNQTVFRLQSLYHTHRTKVATSQISNESLPVTTDANIVRSIVMGKNTAGYYSNVQVDSDSSLGVHIVNPKTSFGEIKVAELDPLTQLQFTYSVNTELIEPNTSKSGSLTIDQARLKLSTGTDIKAFAGFVSKEILKYNPGQGAEVRFTGVFGQPEDTASQFLGLGDSENALRFGYSGTEFGILRRYGGIDEIWKLSFTNFPSKKGTLTITLDSIDIPIVVDNSIDNLGKLYKKITETDFSNTGFKPYYIADGIKFISYGSGTKTGNFSLNVGSTKADYTFTKLRSGQTATNVWTPQSEWNYDKADGTGILPAINFQKGNIFRIQYQWLGFGMLTFSIANPKDGNFITVHKEYYSNMHEIPSLFNPSMPLNAFVNNGTSQKDITLYTSSMAAFIHGNSKKPITRFSASNSITVNSQEKVILALRPKYNFHNTTNRVQISLDTLNICNTGEKHLKFNIYRNPFLTDHVQCQDVNTQNSTVEYTYDTESSGIIPDTGTKLLTLYIAPGATQDKDLANTQFHFVPGDIIVFTVQTIDNGRGNAYLSCTWVEDF